MTKLTFFRDKYVKEMRFSIFLPSVNVSSYTNSPLSNCQKTCAWMPICSISLRTLKQRCVARCEQRMCYRGLARPIPNVTRKAAMRHALRSRTCKGLAAKTEAASFLQRRHRRRAVDDKEKQQTLSTHSEKGPHDLVLASLTYKIQSLTQRCHVRECSSNISCLKTGGFSSGLK